jgi:folate-dependent phosphoribosylglycinamide formyltransferase PurN
LFVVLTYNVPHRKTQDLLFQLKIKTETQIKVIGLPFKYVKKHKPLIQHRPSMSMDIPNAEFCNKLGFSYEDIDHNQLLDRLYELNPKIIILGGAGILEEKIVEEFFVVNSHPGILPDVRGLDALKWAIYLDKRIGVTLHVIDGVADAGFMIKEKSVPLYPEDTFHSIAYRQYEMEIDILSDSIKLLQGIKSKEELGLINISNTKVNKRMGLNEEATLYKKLNDRLQKLK